MKYFILLCFMPQLLFCTEEKTLFEGDMISAIVWTNPNGDFCLIFDSNIIIIDSWHYAEIDD